MDPDQIVQSAIAKLEYICDVPVNEFLTGIEEVNLKMVDLRDSIIARVRQEQDNTALRNYLRNINLALSLLFGLAYPVTGFQRNKIDGAVNVLKQVGPIPAEIARAAA